MRRNAIVIAALIVVGMITSVGYGAVAQTNRPVPSPSQTAPAPTQTAPSFNRRQLSALDRQFIIDAAHGGMAEVRLGELALRRSTSPEVKRFAQQMIEEHSRANEELMRLAKQKGVTPPATPSKYEAAMKRLMQLSGESFDRAYMNEAGVNSHLESTAVYQRQAELGQDSDLKAFAAKILPRVQGHLEMAATMTGYRFARQSSPTIPSR